MVIINLYEKRQLILDWTLVAFSLTSLLILAFSFYQQYVVKIEPCTLCLWQRYIFILIFAISPIGFIQRFNSYIRKILVFIFLMGLGLAIYHTLVQFGWLTDRCVMTQKIENMNDFMKMLEKPHTSCATTGWKLFGLSASIYNGALSFLGLMILNLKNIKRLLHVGRI